ncbi:MAG: 4'-phosphopantetheinyl transferase superfamily protein [Crocinitomix sp.]|nr:4'-phosphopantetheinyl transferase superfamily protein [Crocinitomix sp.]
MIKTSTIASNTVIEETNNLSSLKKGDIQIWSIPLDANEKFRAACLNALGEKGRERISFFKFKQVQESYIISQGGLRLLLSYYLGIPGEEVQLGRLSKGKPFSIDNPTLRFNMSNSGRKVVYAFSMDEEIGLDLERIREMSDLDELIEKNYNSYEQNYINKLPEKRLYRFFKFWTIKEAYLKAIGVGMRIPPEDLEFGVQNGVYTLQSIRGEVDTEDWVFKDFELEDGAYVGTLTIKNVNANISLREVV